MEIDNEKSSREEQSQHGSFFGEIVRFAIITILIVLPVRLYIAQPFIVNGSSMDPTFASGQYLIIDELTYRFREPQRGEVIVFTFPQDKKKFFIKRIIGLPGETVMLRDEDIIVKNKENPEGFRINEAYLERGVSYGALSTTLGENDYFVMGDNRQASFDSRSWGPLSENFIVGRAFVRLFPPDKAAFFPGQI